MDELVVSLLRCWAVSLVWLLHLGLWGSLVGSKWDFTLLHLGSILVGHLIHFVSSRHFFFGIHTVMDSYTTTHVKTHIGRVSLILFHTKFSSILVSQLQTDLVLGRSGILNCISMFTHIWRHMMRLIYRHCRRFHITERVCSQVYKAMLVLLLDSPQWRVTSLPKIIGRLRPLETVCLICCLKCLALFKRCCSSRQHLCVLILLAWQQCSEWEFLSLSEVVLQQINGFVIVF